MFDLKQINPLLIYTLNTYDRTCKLCKKKVCQLWYSPSSFNTNRVLNSRPYFIVQPSDRQLIKKSSTDSSYIFLVECTFCLRIDSRCFCRCASIRCISFLTLYTCCLFIYLSFNIIIMDERFYDTIWTIDDDMIGS